MFLQNKDIIEIEEVLTDDECVENGNSNCYGGMVGVA